MSEGSEEDEKLMNYMVSNGQGCWSDIAQNAELQRCGKSCRLRWINYLRPDLKRGAFSPQEEDLILRLHSILGNRWSQIAARLPFHSPFDPYYNGAFNMEPIYSDETDLLTDRFNADKWITDEDVSDDPWNMEFIQETEQNIKETKSVIYTNKTAARKNHSIYENVEEHSPVESSKTVEMWDTEALVDYTSSSSTSFHCENFPRSQ